MRRHPRRKQQSPAGLPCGSYSGAGTEKRPVACRGLLAVARSAKRPRRDKGYSIPAETQGPEGGTRPLAPRHLWRNGPLAFSGPPCNGFGPSAAAVKCVHRRDVRQPARTRRKGGHHVADPGRSTGVDLGVDAGKAQVGGHHVRPTGRAGIYELRVQCGLEIMRLQFFTAEEVRPWPRCWPNTGRSQGHKPATVDGRPRRDDPRLSPFSFGQSSALGKSQITTDRGSGNLQSRPSPAKRGAEA